MSSKNKPAAKKSAKKTEAQKKSVSPAKKPFIGKASSSKGLKSDAKVSISLAEANRSLGGAGAGVKITLSNAKKAVKENKKVSLSLKSDKHEILKKVAETLKEAASQKPSADQPDRGERKSDPTRPSAAIYFSLADLDAYLASRKNTASTEQKKRDTGSVKPGVESGAVQQAAFVMPAQQKRTLGAASLADILGFNPVNESRAKFQEKDVPKKWKKYYKLLVELREKYTQGISEHSDDVKTRASHDSAGDMNAYGQHLGDAGSESFERDLAFSILSDEKGTVAEIDAAIERIKNGTYGICEITGKPIPESRLEAIPFARYSKEGQEIKEREARKAKLASRNLPPTDFASDGASMTPPLEDSDLPPSLER